MRARASSRCPGPIVPSSRPPGWTPTSCHSAGSPGVPGSSSATVISPTKKYRAGIGESFRALATRERFYGFPTFSGYSPEEDPAAMAILPGTIVREGVWYPRDGGIAAVPRAIARACLDLGVTILAETEAEAIELDGEDRVIGLATPREPPGAAEREVVVGGSVRARRPEQGIGRPAASCPGIASEGPASGGGRPR